MRVLGIETSCDETAVAVFDSSYGLCSHALYSQVDLHAKYGGVVPELASRDHIRRIQPLVRECLHSAGLQPADITAIGYTAGPGLVGALLVGAAFAKALSFAWQIPALAVHHMEGHLLAPLLDKEQPTFPFVALLVSGGHTQLVYVKAIGEYELLGESLDDAAGEAFDKVAKLLGLPYPGGPLLAKLAEEGNPQAYDFPRPLIQRKNYDFSFSGLKTAVVSTVQALSEAELIAKKADLAASFQQAVVDTLVYKCHLALQKRECTTLVIAGGVSANRALREALGNLDDVSLFCPQLAFCTDNAAMIAYAGCQRLLAGQQDDSLGIVTRARWPMVELPAL